MAKISDLEKIKRISFTIWAIMGAVILTGLFLYGLFVIRTILTPFFIALAIVYLLRPFVDYFEKKGLQRTFSIIVVYLIFIIIITLALIFIIPLIYEQFKQFVLQFPNYISVVKKIVDGWQIKILKIDPFLLKSLEEVISNSQQYFVSFFFNLPQAGINIAYLIFNMILAPVLAFYVLKDFKSIKEAFFFLIPKRWRDEAKLITGKIDLVLGGFIKGQLLIAFIVGFMSWLAMAILGVEYALVIGIITGTLNVIPYFGPIVGGTIAVVVALFDSHMLAIWVVVAMVIIQQIDAFFLNPYIMSKQVKVHPVLIVFSLFLGAYILGIIGMILAIPLAAIGKVLVYHFIEKREESKD